MKVFNLNIIADCEPYMAGTISIPNKILNDKKTFLEHLEKLNYLVLGYAEQEEEINVIINENNFVVRENGVTFLEGYLVDEL